MRVINKALLSAYRQLNCIACLPVKNNNDTVAHHIKSRGAGGDDISSNLMPLCVKHHAEVHTYGLSIFSNKYSIVKMFLENNGWYYDETMRKWRS